MAKTPKISVDFSAIQNSLKAQFSGLDPNDPPSWPALPRYLLCVGVTVLVVVALWFVWLSSSDEELTAEQAKEYKIVDEVISSKPTTRSVSEQAALSAQVQK
jgi:type IV pilus assembly protein PilO